MRRPSEKISGGRFSWGDVLLRPAKSEIGGDLQPSIPTHDLTGFERSDKNVPVTPLDEYNARLLDNVKPRKWMDPLPGDGKWDIGVLEIGQKCDLGIIWWRSERVRVDW